MDEKKVMFNQYIGFHEKYSKQYGPETVVLIQSGSHFNIFAMINDEQTIGPDIYHIGNNILNISVTRQNKKIQEVSMNNHLLAGFPVASIQKYETILLNHNYTVVIVEHITLPPNPERAVTRIVSPGTSIENFNKQDSHYLMSVLIEKYNTMNRDSYLVGLSTIDLSTGKNYLHSIITKSEDTNHWSNEIGRYIQFYNPCEILFQTQGVQFSQQDVIQLWDIPNNSIQLNHYQEPHFQKLSFQNDFLKSIFHLQTQHTPIEELDLETHPELVQCYIYLLQYIHDHRAETLENIERPQIVNDNLHMCLTSNSIRQLNVINNYSYFKGKNESLLSVTNHCVTPMGRRLCKERLLYPSLDPSMIQKRYDSIELFRENKMYELIHKQLRKVSDLEKSLRKMGLQLLSSNDFFSDYLSFEYVQKVLTHLQQDTTYLQLHKEDTNCIQVFTEFYSHIQDTFLFSNFTTMGSLERKIVTENVYPELDSYDSLTQDYLNRIQYATKRLSNFLDGSTNSIKCEYDEVNHWHLYCTNKRASTLKERFQNINGNSIHIKDEEGNILYSLKEGDVIYKKKGKTATFIEFSWFSDISKKLVQVQKKVKEYNKEIWSKLCQDMYSKYHKDLKQFYIFLANVDVYCSGAKVSVQNGYCRPQLQKSDTSFLDIQGIRHPIVEKIHVQTEYITNDIELGNNGTDGILLFGTNACGKSTFMKAVGLNLILAQAGFFVAASSFVYSPYTQIFTRILNNDNIFRSQSSFAVEVQELKSILTHADDKSLILGDELCSGTESISALSIITAGLHSLSQRNSTFIFTSHLHQLTELPEIQSLSNLKIYHLKIQLDPKTNTLIYDRKLTEGSGPSIYGLQVCQAMGMDPNFISFAKQIQNKLEQETIIPKKQSQYNTDIFMDKCQICSSKENLETHHIKDQQFADENNMIDHHHKNIKHNLVPLCQKCHLKVTNHEILVSGWKETSQGRHLEWSYVEKKKVISKKKINEAQQETIRKLRHTFPSLTQKDFLKHLHLTENIDISVGILRKILQNNY